MASCLLFLDVWPWLVMDVCPTFLCSRKLGELPDLKKKAVAHSQAFDKALARVYPNPEFARAGFVEMARKDGDSRAAETMWGNPERFGEAHTSERKKWKGLLTEVSKEAAYREASLAADHGRQYLQAAKRLPARSEQQAWTQTLERSEQRARTLGRQLSRLPSSDRLLARIQERVAGLTPK